MRKGRISSPKHTSPREGCAQSVKLKGKEGLTKWEESSVRLLVTRELMMWLCLKSPGSPFMYMSRISQSSMSDTNSQKAMTSFE